MKNKFINYAFGFVALGVIITSFLLSKIVLFFVSIFFIIISMFEYRTMFKAKNIYPHILIPEITGIVLAYLFIFYPYSSGVSFILPVLILSVIMSFMVTIVKNKKPYFETSMSTILVVIFIFCGLYIIKIPSLVQADESIKLLLVYFSSVLFGDFAASKIGPYGKIPLLKEISPNKTVLGAISNIICSCLICLILIDIMHPLHCILLGLIISVSSQIGDLTLSSIKRSLNLKHSGALFLDYGGIFDRIDAFIFSAPVIYYFLLLKIT